MQNRVEIGSADVLTIVTAPFLAGKDLARVGLTPAPDSKSMGSVTLSRNRSPADPVLDRTLAIEAHSYRCGNDVKFQTPQHFIAL